MVTAAVWQAAGMPAPIAREYNASGGDFLCVGCLETRLGRRLVSADFTKALINEPSPWDTPRLAVRKSGHRTSIHEAAHAVIGRALGMTCGGATIAADETTGEAGFSICADPLEIAGHWDQEGRYRDLSLIFRGRILSYMAGAEAERVILGACHGGDGDDRRQIEMMAESDDCDFDEVRWAWREPRMRAMAGRLVTHHRAAIERLASALEARETMSGDEIDAVIGAG